MSQQSYCSLPQPKLAVVPPWIHRTSVGCAAKPALRHDYPGSGTKRQICALNGAIQMRKEENLTVGRTSRSSPRHSGRRTRAATTINNINIASRLCGSISKTRFCVCCALCAETASQFINCSNSRERKAIFQRLLSFLVATVKAPDVRSHSTHAPATEF